MPSQEPKVVPFETFEGVEIVVDEQGQFTFTFSKNHKPRSFGRIQDARDEIRVLRRREELGKRKRPKAPCLAVVRTDTGRWGDGEWTSSWAVLPATFEGFTEAGELRLRGPDKRMIEREKTEAVFPVAGREAAEAFRAARVANAQALLVASKSLGTSPIENGRVRFEEYRRNRWDKKAGDWRDAQLDVGTVAERLEDNIVATLNGKPEPWPLNTAEPKDDEEEVADADS